MKSAESAIAEDDIASRETTPLNAENNCTNQDIPSEVLGSNIDHEEDEEDRYWDEFQLKNKRKRKHENRYMILSSDIDIKSAENKHDTDSNSNDWSSGDESVEETDNKAIQPQMSTQRNSKHVESPGSLQRKRGRPRKESAPDSPTPGDNKDTKSEPTSPKKTPGRKGRTACKDPNKTDKAGRTKLFAATSAGHFDLVKTLLAQGANVNFRDNAGWTPLHEAALKGQADIVRCFISNGADINARGFGGDTPLHDACSNEYASCVRVLVDAGADVFALNDKKERPYDVCEDEECLVILKEKMNELDRLVERNQSGRTILHDVCAKGIYDEAQSLLSQGANVNAQDDQGWTPLHEASFHNHGDIVVLLIDHGADINSRGRLGDTPLQCASSQGHEDLVEQLITAGADVRTTNDQGENAYDVSESPAVRRLLTAKLDEICRQAESGADELAATPTTPTVKNPLTHPDLDLDRPLTREERKIQAYMRVFERMEKPRRGRPRDVMFGQEDIFFVPPTTRRKRTHGRQASDPSDLRDSEDQGSPKVKKVDPHKLDPHKKDTSGRTHLHKWAKRGEYEVCQVLLENGAFANETDHAGYTPLHEAALRGHLKVVRLLLDHKADANSMGAEQDTPLHDATENNHYDVAKLLLERGANPHAGNIHNKTPLDCAVDNGYDRAEQLIREWMEKVPASQFSRSETSHEKDEEPPATDPSTELGPSSSKVAKRRRLVRAASMEPQEENKGSRSVKVEPRTSPGPPMQIKKEHWRKSRNITYRPQPLECNEIHSHTPIPTPPPESWSSSGRVMQVKKEEEISERSIVHRLHQSTTMSNRSDSTLESYDPMRYLPLYTVQLSDQSFVVVDLQVSMLIGVSADEFWKRYAQLHRVPIRENEKHRLWPTLAAMIAPDTHLNERPSFPSTPLYFIRLDDVVALIKSDYNDLSDKLITFTLDIGYEERSLPPHPPAPQLPPKFALKMRRCGMMPSMTATTKSSH